MAGGTRGDQHVRVVVETPGELPAEYTEHLEALGKLEGEAHYPQRAQLWKKLEE